MANPLAGEVAIVLNGERRVMKLTLGALAELEERLAVGSLVDLVARFEGNSFSAGDLLELIRAGLRGGGWGGCMDELRTAEIGGGLGEASRCAALLLVRAFTPIGEG